MLKEDSLIPVERIEVSISVILFETLGRRMKKAVSV
jgi:hypothetical protein